MRSRDVVGKRIVRIEQQVVSTRTTGNVRATSVAAIVLEDGTELRPVTCETDFGFYVTELVVRKPKKEGA